MRRAGIAAKDLEVLDRLITEYLRTLRFPELGAGAAP